VGTAALGCPPGEAGSFLRNSIALPKTSFERARLPVAPPGANKD